MTEQRQFAPNKILTSEDVDQWANGNRGEITRFDIPEGVEAIDDYAFSCCYRLNGVSIPESVKRIGEGAFCECCGLTSVEIPADVTTIEEHAFSDCCCLTRVTIPEGVTLIGEYAFRGCSSLKHIVFPGSVRAIQFGAFKYCVSLETVTFQDGGREPLTIEDSAFEACAGISTITFPSRLRGIGSAAFAKCVSLTDLRLPGGVEKIGRGAFYKCAALRYAACPSPKAEWMDYAFWGCGELQTVLFSEGCSFGKQVFQNCARINRSGQESPEFLYALAENQTAQGEHTRLLEPRHLDYYWGIHGLKNAAPPEYLEMACYDDAAETAINCEYYHFDMGNLHAAHDIEDRFFDSQEREEKYMEQLALLNAGKIDYFIDFVYFPNGKAAKENGGYSRLDMTLPPNKTLFQIKNQWGLSSYYAVIFVKEKRPLMPDVVCEWMERLSPALFGDRSKYQIPAHLLERERVLEVSF